MTRFTVLAAILLSAAIGVASAADAQSSGSQFNSQINATMNNNLMFLAVQTKVQNVSQTTQLMSNIIKADSYAKLATVRKLRP